VRKIIVAAICILVVSGSNAGGQVIYLSEDPNFGNWDCNIPDEGVLVNIYVFAYSWFHDFTAVHFSAPLPPCFVGATHLNETPPSPFLSIGNSQTGIAIAFGQCLEPPIHVLTITVMVQGLTETCCPYPVLPHPASTSGEIEFVDCDQNLITGWPGETTFVTTDWSLCNTDTTTISNTYPPDGATDVPLDVILGYDYELPHRCPACTCAEQEMFYFGSAPDALSLYSPNTGGPYQSNFDPGTLTPGTTYYWYAAVAYIDHRAQTEVMSFTTTGPSVPAERTTWGRIKALYR
jgi:hypothetical protein